MVVTVSEHLRQAELRISAVERLRLQEPACSRFSQGRGHTSSAGIPPFRSEEMLFGYVDEDKLRGALKPGQIHQ